MGSGNRSTGMGFSTVIDRIRKKSREEWVQGLKDQWRDWRIWVQEHGELAFFGGIVLGFMLVFLLKFFIGLLAIGIICAFVVYQIALPDAEIRAPQSSRPVSAQGQPQGQSEEKSEEIAVEEEFKEERTNQ